jgi:hypothetical protein
MDEQIRLRHDPNLQIPSRLLLPLGEGVAEGDG